jgi:hypothetical protein
MFRSAGCILLSVCLFVPLGAWLYNNLSVSPAEVQKISRQFVMSQACAPEPGERYTFMAGALVLPVLIFAFGFASRQWNIGRAVQIPTAVGHALEWGLGVSLLAFCWWAARGDGYYHLRMNCFFRHPCTTLPLFAGSYALIAWGNWRLRGVQLLGRGIALFLLVCIFLTSLCSESGEYVRWMSFTAMFDPVVQVYLGKALLIDYNSQYGLYPHFLQPLFAICGLGVVRFTVVMGLLLAGSYALLWRFLRQAVANQFVALLGFAAVVVNGCFSAYFNSGLWDKWLCFDRYFQYFPIRLIFPVALVALAWSYFRNPGRLRYWATTVFLAAGVLWNFDAGLPAFITWLVVLCYADLGKEGTKLAKCRNILQHGLGGMLALLTVVALYSSAIYLHYGRFPDYGAFFRYQQLFYVSGFFMLPMPLPGTWLVVILVYLAGFAYAAHCLFGKCPSLRANMVLLLSVLGVGLFSYYQGRSCPPVLATAWWPSILLMAIFLDELVSRGRDSSRRPLETILALLLVWVLAGSCWGIIGHRFGQLETAVVRELQMLQPLGSAPVEREVALLKQAIRPGEQALVISAYWQNDLSTLYCLDAQIPSASRGPLVQLLTTEDIAGLCRMLERRPDILVFEQNEARATALLPGYSQLLELLRTKYGTLAETDQGRLLISSKSRRRQELVGFRQDWKSNSSSQKGPLRR